MFYRIFSQKDTFVTNYKLNSVPRTGSNFGDSEILHVYKEAGISGSSGIAASASLAHILTKFDVNEYLSVSSSLDVPIENPVFFLRMFDAQHDHELPSSFDMEIQALSQDWDEGRGRDVDFFSDLGYANWVKAKSNVYWNVPGGEGTGSIVTAHFDSGHENIDVDVTAIVNQWLGGMPNNGFLVRISSSQESDLNDYYIKMFHGRNTFFPDRRPHLEVRWNDFSADDRGNFFFDVSGTLRLGYVVGGVYTNLPNIGTGSVGVKIVDASGTLGFFTGSYSGTPGHYAVSFALPSASYSGSSFHDVWFDLNNTSRWFMTGTFGVGAVTPRDSFSDARNVVAVTNLRSWYSPDEIVRLNTFVRPYDYNPARVLTASLGASGLTVASAYYKVVNDLTEEVVVPFGTGSQQHTRLSYDSRGGNFVLPMNTFAPGNVYRIDFLMNIDGQRVLVNRNFTFKVTR